MSNNFPSQSGDLIFLSPAKNKSINTIAQSLIRLSRARQSHIAIVVKQGNVIHAMPKQGVQVESIRNLLKERKSKFFVFRKKGLSQSEKIVTLEDHLWHYNLQKYNYRFFFKSRRNASFCSELAAKSYAFINMKISDKAPGNTLPIDIYKHINTGNDWDNVTELYEKFFLRAEYPDVLEVASNFVREIELRNQAMSYGQNIFKGKIDLVAKSTGSVSPKIDIPRSYWTDPVQPSTSSVILSMIKNFISKHIKK